MFEFSIRVFHKLNHKSYYKLKKCHAIIFATPCQEELYKKFSKSQTFLDPIKKIWYNGYITWTMELYIIGTIVCLLVIFNLFVYALEGKIGKLERRIKTKFISRTNLVPAIFEVSREHVLKHSDIFKEILHLRKVEFSENENDKELSEMIQTEWRIHHELNFIFKVCNSHPKLLKEGKFIYLRELIVDKSLDLWKDIDVYRKIVKRYNTLVSTNKLFLIGLFMPMLRKSEI